MVGPDRFELSTNWLKASCSTTELRTQEGTVTAGTLIAENYSTDFVRDQRLALVAGYIARGAHHTRSFRDSLFRSARHIARRIGDIGRAKPIASQTARIAFAASSTVARRLVTGDGQAEIDAQLFAAPNDVGF